MNREIINNAVKRLNCALKLDRKIAGIKFLFDKDEFDNAGAKALKVRMPYCVMVRNAMEGKFLKATADSIGCFGGAKAVGMMEADEQSLSGRFYHKLGLYNDLATAKNVQQNVTFCKHKLFGIMTGPLDKYTDEPDIVIIITNPYNGMRIMQAYSYMYGCNTSLKMTGNQAICSECTSYPFENNNINVSFLCAGTRYKAKWKDDELAIGFPFNRFLSIEKGLYDTIDVIEPNEKKDELQIRFKEQGIECPDIHYNRNYYTGLNPTD